MCQLMMASSTPSQIMLSCCSHKISAHCLADTDDDDLQDFSIKYSNMQRAHDALQSKLHSGEQSRT